MKLIKSLAVTLTLSMGFNAYSKVIQILHTNDLHSYFEGTRAGIGGYAQLKTVLDELRQSAEAQGIPTLHLDAGDFGEGSSFYFSNEGVDSLRALDLLGVDVTVLGNHDFILGGRELSHQIKKAKLKAKILSANLFGKRLMGLHSLMPDYVDMKFDDLKIRVFGLTTNEIHYMYPLRPFGFIANPQKVGIRQAEKAQKAKVDFTIALTHIGLNYDIELVQKTRTIDLVVGGHDHTKLSKPQLTKNLSGRLIPIVQAGSHSGYVGSMIVDIQGNGEAQLIDYKMIDIKRDMPQDRKVASFVEEAAKNREAYFGRKWNEAIGFSNIPLSGDVNGQNTESNTCWDRHMAKLTREVAGTELGLQFEVFQGENVNPGTITFGDVVDNFPHFRKWGDQGWSISTTKVSGILLKQVINLLSKSELAIQIMIDGLETMDKGKRVAFNPKKHDIERATLNGEPLQNMRYYSVALPSEVPYGIRKFLRGLGTYVLHDLRSLNKAYYWPMIENYIRTNSPLNCVED